jgi:hypothetical protein
MMLGEGAGDYRHELRRIGAAFKGSELQNFETVGIPAAQGDASLPARGVDGDDERHKWWDSWLRRSCSLTG